MNTDRIKNIMIVLLSAAIVAFSVLIVMEGDRYTLTVAMEENVAAVLDRNNMSISTEIVRDFNPRRQLSLEFYDYDLEGIAARFFGDAVPPREFMQNTIEYYCEHTGKIMTHNNRSGSIFFGVPNGMFVGVCGGDFYKNAASAEALARTFVEEVLGADVMPLHSTILTRQGNYVITFFEGYGDYLMFNNQIRVRITDMGVVYVFYSRMQSHGFAGYAQPIFSADEMLITLLAHLRAEGYEKQDHISVIDMQLVYAFDAHAGISRGVPAYFFTISIGTEVWIYYRVFNAHTGRPIHGETTLISGPHL
ncbi:MAG: hypothetical protein FWE21_00260 [Defluviitaleaceae bacterium]|nr:hypothetical protein [Defluviitaleaceae bacterium]